MSPTNVMQLSTSSSPGVSSPTAGSKRISLCSSPDCALTGSPQVLQQSQVGPSTVQGIQAPQHVQQQLSAVGVGPAAVGPAAVATSPVGGGGMWPHVPQQQHSPSPTQLTHAHVAVGLVRAAPSALISSNLAEMHLRQGSTDSGFGVLFDPLPSSLRTFLLDFRSRMAWGWKFAHVLQYTSNNI